MKGGKTSPVEVLHSLEHVHHTHTQTKQNEMKENNTKQKQNNTKENNTKQHNRIRLYCKCLPTLARTQWCWRSWRRRDGTLPPPTPHKHTHTHIHIHAHTQILATTRAYQPRHETPSHESNNDHEQVQYQTTSPTAPNFHPPQFQGLPDQPDAPAHIR